MSRQQRRKRTELPPDVWSNPDAYLGQIFPGFERVERRSGLWCLRISGRLVPLGTSLEIRSTPHVQQRLRQVGLLPMNAPLPLLWSRRTLLPALRRAFTLDQTRSTP